jgi:integral membrane protein (TIGR01906 family)
VPRERAPLAVALAFGVSIAVLLTLVGPLLLFNPWFTSALQSRHGVAEAFSTSQAEVDRVTGEILVDLYVDGSFDAALEGQEPLLDESERSHMHDVSRLVRILAGVALVAAAVAVASGMALRRERRRMGLVLLVAAGTVGTVAILLAGTFAVAFEPAFLAFHELFFPPGTYLFAEGSNLITLFPQGFWFDAALAAGATIMLAALLVSLVGLNRWRGGPRSPDPA